MSMSMSIVTRAADGGGRAQGGETKAGESQGNDVAIHQRRWLILAAVLTATFMAILAGTIGVASVLGQVVGGVLIDADLWGLAWRPVFLINVPVGLAALVAAVAVLPAFRSPARARLDVSGVGLVTVALLLLAVP